jgi:NADH-quinone oxidoreductase subunit M
MTDFPWLTTIGVVPLAGAAVIAVLPRGRDQLVKVVALATSLVVLGLIIAMSLGFEAGGGYQFTESAQWIPSFGTSYSLGVDGIALVLLALVAVLVPVVLLASWNDAEAGTRSVKTFFALLLVLETTLIGVFAATDVFLFYVFFEAMLIPMYFIIGSYGGARRSYAAVKFFLYSLFGGLVMLAAVIGLYVVSLNELGTGTFDLEALRTLDIDPGVQRLLFLGFFLAFAIKAPLFPFHTWLPDAGAEAPTGGAVLLVGVLDKVGTFGFIRYCIPLFPEASAEFAPVVIVLAIISILYGALLAMGQTDLKRLVSYTSVAHFGFITLGVFAFTTESGTGAVLYMVNHGLSTGALFLVIGFLVSRRGTRLMSEYGGVAKVAPLLAGAFLVAGLSSLALPGTNAFVSEFLVLLGTFSVNVPAAILATLGIVLAALYVLLAYQRTMTGPLKPGNERMKDLVPREVFVIAPVLALVVALGFYPKPLLDVITPAVEVTYSDAGYSDPVPTLATDGSTE